MTFRALLALAVLAAPALAQEPAIGAHGLSLPATFTGTRQLPVGELNALVVK